MRHMLVKALTGGEVESSKKLTSAELQKMIEGMQPIADAKTIAEAAA